MAWPLLRALSPHARWRSSSTGQPSKQAVGLVLVSRGGGAPWLLRRRAQCLRIRYLLGTQKATGRQRVNGGQLQTMASSAQQRESRARASTVFRRLQSIRNGSISGAQGLRLIFASTSRASSSRSSIWQNGATRRERCAPHASPASHTPPPHGAGLHPKTLSLIVRFNCSVPTGPAKKTDCRTNAAGVGPDSLLGAT